MMPFMSWSLKVAALYNIMWGAWVILFPNAAFEFMQIEPPRYPQIWQCVGMIVGVYGIGYYLASKDPIKHWPITFVGLLGKVLGPIGFLHSYLVGQLPGSFFTLIIFNDLIWWPSFVYIMLQVYKRKEAQ